MSLQPLYSLSEVVNYDWFYKKTSAACWYPRSWFQLSFHDPEAQLQNCLPIAQLNWQGPGNTPPPRCKRCHLPQYESRTDDEKLIRATHKCIFLPCHPVLESVLNPHPMWCS